MKIKVLSITQGVFSDDSTNEKIEYQYLMAITGKGEQKEGEFIGVDVAKLKTSRDLIRTVNPSILPCDMEAGIEISSKGQVRITKLTPVVPSTSSAK
jgi:hypothetical protein